MRLLNMSMPEERVMDIVKAVNLEAVRQKRRLTDDEFRKLVAVMK